MTAWLVIGWSLASFLTGFFAGVLAMHKDTQ